MSSDFGLQDELTDEMKKNAKERARIVLNRKKAFDRENNLQADLKNFWIDDQKFCVVNWIGPEMTAKTKINGMRILGAFPDLKSAQKYALKFNKKNRKFDAGVMEMYHWCISYPRDTDEHDLVGDEINQIIIEHKTLAEERRQEFNIRKQEIQISENTVEKMLPDDDLEKLEKEKFHEGKPNAEMEKKHESEISQWKMFENVKNVEEDVFKMKSNTAKKIQYIVDSDSDSDSDLDLEDNELNLMEEIKKIEFQNYAVISMIPKGNNSRIPINIKGIFNTYEEAEKHTDYLNTVCDDYDIFIVDMYKWFVSDPDISKVKNQKYGSNNKELQDLLDSKKEEEKRAQIFHNKREDIMNNNTDGIDLLDDSYDSLINDLVGNNIADSKSKPKDENKS